MTDDIDALIADLKAKAGAATSGPWAKDDYECKPGDLREGVFGIFELGEDDPALAYVGPWGESEANAAYIAAANPAAILSLIAEVERLRALTQDGETERSKEAVKCVAEAIDVWVEREIKNGEGVPDFLDEMGTSNRLAEWLVHTFEALRAAYRIDRPRTNAQPADMPEFVALVERWRFNARHAVPGSWNDGYKTASNLCADELAALIDRKSAAPAPVPQATPPFRDAQGHRTRMSDSSLYDEVCLYCGARDHIAGDTLCEPCTATEAEKVKVDAALAQKGGE